MSLTQRLQRLETREQEREFLEMAERLAQEFGLAPDDVLRQLRETTERIARWGIDAELRRLARDHGRAVEDVHRHYEALLAEEEP